MCQILIPENFASRLLSEIESDENVIDAIEKIVKTLAKRKYITDLSWLDHCILPDNLIPNKTSFKKIWDLHPEEHLNIRIYGKLIPVPRWQQSYGKNYEFSGIIAKGIDIPDELLPYFDFANSMGYSGKFNSALLNWYKDGNHYISSHADGVTKLLPDSPIITITLCLPGEPRIFRIRDKNKGILKDITTTNGLVLVMGGKFQNELKHEIVKMTGKRAEKAGSRISITLRQFK